MNVFKTLDAFKAFRDDLDGHSIGFVPTMGALHDGHLSLIRRSVDDNRITLVSIFVNPTQFDKADDLLNYPDQLQTDLTLLEKAGVNAVFLPDFGQMYPDKYHYQIKEVDLSKKYCGRHRPGHFDGVLSVVMKLFNIIRPTVAYFGEKDQQQLSLIQGMLEAFFMPVKIVACVTLRESDGLAMSSRNTRLSAEQRQTAPKLYQIISSACSLKQMKTQLLMAGFKLDYLEMLDDRLLVAAYLGDVRLIDNVLVSTYQLKKLKEVA